MRLGAYGDYRNIDFVQVRRLIFICSGNICRSPLAEVVAADMGVKAESYGLHCRGGDKADSRAIAYAESLGVSLHEHITRNISCYTLLPGDLLVGMEPKHNDELIRRFTKNAPMTLAGLWLNPPKPYIHDPHNTHLEFFNKCELLVANATRTLAGKISN